MMGEVKNSHKVEVQYQRFKKSWNLYKNSKGNALFKAVLHAFRCKGPQIFSYLLTKIIIEEYLIAIFLNLIATGLEIASPFLIKRTIEFIQDDS